MRDEASFGLNKNRLRILGKRIFIVSGSSGADALKGDEDCKIVKLLQFVCMWKEN